MHIGNEDEKGIGQATQEMLEAAGDKLEDAAGEANDGLEEEAGEFARLDLDEDDRLPWLETSDDDYDEGGIDGARVFGFVLAGLVALGVIVGGIWWLTHRKPDPALLADGSTIAAPPEPYKTAPANPGGKSLAGTGNTSYAVSQGKPASAVTAAEAPKPSISTGPQPAPATGGVGVQVGAFTSKDSAEAGWGRLSTQSSLLKGLAHRVVEGNSEGAKVFRLQAVAGDEASALALCSKLKAAGIPCQVKR